MRTAALAAAALAACAVLLECAGAGLLARLEAGAPPGSLRGVDAERLGLDSLHGADWVLHPYLGYVASRRSEGVNAFGLFGPDPLEPAPPDEVRIAVTGGSLAAALRFHEESLARALERVGAFSGRRPSLLVGALGGYKQPQQLQQLAFLLALGARIDAVVNLDGFNEVALPWTENRPAGVYPFYPRSWHIFSQQGFDRELALDVARVEAAAARREHWRQRLVVGPLGASRLLRATGLLLDRELYADWQAALEELEAGLTRRGVDEAAAGPPTAAGSEAEYWADLVRVWSESSLQMARLCEANGIPYYHFLQPNQYVLDSKPLSPAERETAIAAPGNLFRQAVERAYPLLREAGAGLAARGVAFHDLTPLFREETQTVYVGPLLPPERARLRATERGDRGGDPGARSALMELILVRHGLPERVETRDGSPADPPLAPRGRHQAEALARWLAREEIDAVVASPLRRARQTAEPLARALGVEIALEPDVVEMDHGSGHLRPPGAAEARGLPALAGTDPGGRPLGLGRRAGLPRPCGRRPGARHRRPPGRPRGGGLPRWRDQRLGRPRAGHPGALLPGPGLHQRAPLPGWARRQAQRARPERAGAPA